VIPLVKTSSVFRSRWKALLWAIPIVWFAYDVGTSMPQSDGNSANAEEPSDTSPDTAAQNKIPATWN
jgi:hypothetical protein